MFTKKSLINSQNRNLRRGLYKTRDTKIRDLICRIDKMVEYLEKFPTFGEGQCLPDNEILKLVEFSLPREWKKELIIQGFDSATQSLTELVEFCKSLDNSEEIL